MERIRRLLEQAEAFEIFSKKEKEEQLGEFEKFNEEGREEYLVDLRGAICDHLEQLKGAWLCGKVKRQVVSNLKLDSKCGEYEGDCKGCVNRQLLGEVEVPDCFGSEIFSMEDETCKGCKDYRDCQDEKGVRDREGKETSKVVEPVKTKVKETPKVVEPVKTKVKETPKVEVREVERVSNNPFGEGSVSGWVFDILTERSLTREELEKLVLEKFGKGGSIVNDIIVWGGRFGRLKKDGDKMSLESW